MSIAISNFNISNILMATFIFAPIQAGKLKMQKTMKKERIVPDVIDTLPHTLLQVKYSEDEVKFGNVLSLAEVQKVPVQMEWLSNNTDLYTLLMVTPDDVTTIENNPKRKETLFWLVVNIPRNKIQNGDTVVEYNVAKPEKSVGLCKYVFLVYKQFEKLQLNTIDRTAFKTRNFSAENKLIGPVAGNFFKMK